MTEQQEAAKPKILIVEDEAIVAIDLKSSLEQLGYAVLAHVNSAEKALEMSEQDPPDLVLMDIVLKGKMDGIEAADIIRSRCGIPVVFVTSYADQKRLKRAKLVNPFGYILKPFQDNDLKVTVEMALYISRVDRERQKAQEALRESEESYRNLFENANEAILVVQDGKIVFLNPRTVMMTGYPAEELLSRPFIEFIHPDDRDMVMDRRVKRLKGEEIPQIYDFRIIHRDGNLRWIELNAVVLNWKGGNATLNFMSDITDRKLAEMKLRESEEKYRSLASAEDSMYLVDKECRFRFMNQAHLSRFGLSLDEIIGRSYGEFHSEEDSRQFASIVKKVFETNTSFQAEHQSEREPKYFLRTLSPVRDPQGNVTAVTVISKDITKRKQAEKELVKYQKQLQTLAIRLSEVEETERKEIARTLHDLVGQNLTALNLNLTIILGMLSEDQNPLLVSRLEDSQKLLEETTQYIREVMSDLRPSVLDDFGLTAALRWVGRRFNRMTGIQTNVEGEDFSPRLPPILETIIFRIAQEALTNVLKHASAGKVDLRIEKGKDKVRLTITDDGQGFIFKGFRFGGEKRGWGLATMRERAVALGGDLQIYTEPGKGTRVILELPVEG